MRSTELLPSNNETKSPDQKMISQLEFYMSGYNPTKSPDEIKQATALLAEAIEIFDHANKSDQDKALNCLNRIENEHGCVLEPNGHNIRGIIYLSQMNLKKALKSYIASIESTRDDIMPSEATENNRAKCNFYIGIIFFKLEQYEKAKLHLIQAIHHDANGKALRDIKILKDIPRMLILCDAKLNMNTFPALTSDITAYPYFSIFYERRARERFNLGVKLKKDGDQNTMLWDGIHDISIAIWLGLVKLEVHLTSNIELYYLQRRHYFLSINELERAFDDHLQILALQPNKILSDSANMKFKEILSLNADTFVKQAKAYPSQPACQKEFYRSALLYYHLAHQLKPAEDSIAKMNNTFQAFFQQESREHSEAVKIPRELLLESIKRNIPIEHTPNARAWYYHIRCYINLAINKFEDSHLDHKTFLAYLPYKNLITGINNEFGNEVRAVGEVYLKLAEETYHTTKNPELASQVCAEAIELFNLSYNIIKLENTGNSLNQAIRLKAKIEIKHEEQPTEKVKNKPLKKQIKTTPAPVAEILAETKTDDTTQSNSAELKKQKEQARNHQKKTRKIEKQLLNGEDPLDVLNVVDQITRHHLTLSQNAIEAIEPLAKKLAAQLDQLLVQNKIDELKQINALLYKLFSNGNAVKYFDYLIQFKIFPALFPTLTDHEQVRTWMQHEDAMGKFSLNRVYDQCLSVMPEDTIKTHPLIKANIVRSTAGLFAVSANHSPVAVVDVSPKKGASL